ncbi:MAG TPA: hypothetical protein VFS08_02085 [Gemmatimonadaceae bacterium]|nr:hypothetical protein [Gemmatimonadaceae bacterium]
MRSTPPSRRPLTVRALRLAAAALLTLAAAPACRSTPNGENGEAPTPQPPTTLAVENRSFNDMTIYVLRGTQRLRLGTATGNSTTRFTIPAHLIFGATSLQFLADPIGGSQRPVSESIVVTAGDELRLQIPPT